MSGAFKSGVMGGLMGFIMSAPVQLLSASDAFDAGGHRRERNQRSHQRLHGWVHGSPQRVNSKAQTQTLGRLVSIFEKHQAFSTKTLTLLNEKLASISKIS